MDFHRERIVLLAELQGALDVSPRARVESTSSLRRNSGRRARATRIGQIGVRHFVVF
jgi:hypothetical protein